MFLYIAAGAVLGLHKQKNSEVLCFVILTSNFHKCLENIFVDFIQINV